MRRKFHFIKIPKGFMKSEKFHNQTCEITIFHILKSHEKIPPLIHGQIVSIYTTTISYYADVRVMF